MPCNVSYIDSSVTVECSKVVLDIRDDNFIVIRFYDDKTHPFGSVSSVHRVYISPPPNSRFDYFNGKIESGDSYILMETKQNEQQSE